MSKLVMPLIPLQTLDVQIHKLRVQRNEKPRELSSWNEKLEKSRGLLNAVRDECRALKLQGTQREGEVKEFDARIQKITVQSNTAKKNEEYQALLKEISGIKADRGRMEDGLLDIYMQLDEKSKLEKLRSEELAAVEAEYQQNKSRIDGEAAELGKQIEALQEQRRGLLASIEGEVLRIYDRILQAKDDGLALAAIEVLESVDGDGPSKSFSCQGCSVGVNFQDVNQAMKGRELVFCRACSRILYVANPEPATPS